MKESQHKCFIINCDANSYNGEILALYNNVRGSTVNVKNMSVMEIGSEKNKNDVIEHIQAVSPMVFDSLTVIGYAVGGKQLMQSYGKLKEHFDSFRRVSLVFVDAYSPLPNYYGKYRGMNLDTRSNMHCSDSGVKVWNVYQQNSKPYGCVVRATSEMKSCMIKDKNVGHADIVHTVEVMRSISEAMNWATLGM